jgi:hypothetical protein
MRRDELLQKFVGLKQKEVDLGDGATVIVRELMASESANLKGKSDTYWFAAGVLDPEGRRMFDPNSPQDIEAIDKLPVRVVQDAVVVILDLCGFNRPKEAAKN